MSDAEKEYHVFDDEKLTGPWSQDQMLDSWNKGFLKANTLCSVKGVEGWIKAGQLDFLQDGIKEVKAAWKINEDSVKMRQDKSFSIFGMLLVLIGIIGVIVTLFGFNVVVQTEVGGVNNLGLIGDRICWLIASVGSVLFGGQLLILDATRSK